MSTGLIVTCPSRKVLTIASAELAAPPALPDPAPVIRQWGYGSVRDRRRRNIGCSGRVIASDMKTIQSKRIHLGLVYAKKFELTNN